ncbi:unnamed protein product [Caenorhabditis sp. 36 PRJEB53466]|nr:unnamed protein product [Caenorhabditis sp. 36 PRJEB53466]
MAIKKRPADLAQVARKTKEEKKKKRKKVVHLVYVSFMALSSVAAVSFGFHHLRTCSIETRLPILIIVSGVLPLLERTFFFLWKMRIRMAERSLSLLKIRHIEDTRNRDVAMKRIQWTSCRWMADSCRVAHVVCLIILWFPKAVGGYHELCDPYVLTFAISYSAISLAFLLAVSVASTFFTTPNFNWNMT